MRLLINRRVSIPRRLKLCDATVGSCVHWETESWTPRAHEFRELASARHTMLRGMGAGIRFPEETQLEWIRRTTHVAVCVLNAAPVRDWKHAHLESKWHWAWLKRICSWRDATSSALVSQAGLCLPTRPSTRRWGKFKDDCRYVCRC